MSLDKTKSIIEVLIILIHLIYAIVTITLLIQIRRQYLNKVLYPYVMRYTLLLFTNYLFEIALAIAQCYNSSNVILMILRTITIITLHPAYVTLMYGTVYSTKHVLIIAQKLGIYYFILFAIVVNILLIVAYVGTKILLSIINEFSSNQYFVEEILAAAVYTTYTVIMMCDILVKKKYQYEEYNKRCVYRWSIVFCFMACVIGAACGIIFFERDSEEKFIYDSIVNIFIDTLPIYCTIFLLAGYEKKTKQKSIIDSFFKIPNNDDTQ